MWTPIGSLFVLALVAGCKASGDDGDFPINPGGNGGNGNGTMPDAGPDDASTDAARTLSGRVCVQTDLRDRTSCANTGFADLVVTLGAEQARTEADGRFTIAQPPGSMLVWRVAGAPIVSSVMPFSADTVIPAVSAATYDELLASNGQFFFDGQGSLVARIVRSNGPLRDAVATLGNAQNGATFYDSNSRTTWDQDATDAFGVAWFPSELVGTYTLTVSPPLGSQVTQPIVLENLSITFVTVDVP